ncbi:MAG: hypothetical protein M1821_007732 [Bathelium mastoideum]|nr:MAG: hypothetical protein M1821_007732 [Bathelium mastoideum]
MEVTKAMEETFCWIDALCIFQDSVKRKQHQISEMDAIYSKAIITIVAADGDVQTGLPGVRTNLRTTLPHDVLDLGSVRLIKTIGVEDTCEFGGRDKSPWQKRAWTYQEAIFSRRLLIFRDQQVFWRCRSASWMESKILETKSPSFKLMSLEWLCPQQKFLHHNIDRNSNATKMRHHMPNMQDDFFPLLCGYFGRRLSFGSDTLNAFAGISRALSLYYNDEIIWGLPKSCFTQLLLCNSERKTYSKSSQAVILPGGDVHQIPFPSWSWAAWWAPAGYDIQKERLLYYPEQYLCCVAIYSVLIDWTIVAITQPDADLGSQHDSTRRWMGQPQSIDGASMSTDRTMIHSGTLKFWTSTALIYHLKGQHGQLGRSIDTYYSSDGHLLNAGAKQGLTSPFFIGDPLVPRGLRNMKFKNSQGCNLEGDLEFRQLELVIISCTLSPRMGFEGKSLGPSGIPHSGKRLHALIVVWNSGVASRTGTASIDEEHWALLPNREWKLVTLR